MAKPQPKNQSSITKESVDKQIKPYAEQTTAQQLIASSAATDPLFFRPTTPSAAAKPLFFRPTAPSAATKPLFFRPTTPSAAAEPLFFRPTIPSAAR